MQARLQFKTVAPEYSVGPLLVRTMHLPHPGGCVGYRVQAGESTFVLATDCELDQAALNRDEIVENHHAPRVYDPELIHFLSNANLLVIDCQYTDALYQKKVGWGHNSIATIVDLCRQVQPDSVALFHHDPQHDDNEVRRMAFETATRLLAADVADTLVFAAREGVKLRIEKPLPAVKLASMTPLFDKGR